MARKSAENHRIRVIHLDGRLNGVLVEFLQEAINTSLAPTSSAQRVPIPNSNQNIFQYPIHTQFVFKIIGYFGYRVFQNTMFLTWKTALRSNKISSYIIFI